MVRVATPESKFRRRFAVVAFLVLLTTWGVLVFWGTIFTDIAFRIATPEQLAEKVIHRYSLLPYDPDKVMQKCVDMGDEMVAALDKELSGSQNLLWDVPYRLVKILVEIDSPASIDMLEAMYRRDCEAAGTDVDPRDLVEDCQQVRMIGACGLVLKGKFEHPIDENSAIIRDLRTGPGPARALASLALGNLGNKEVVPYLIEVLLGEERTIGYAFGVAGSLGVIGDPRAIDPLRSCLKNDQNVRYIFRALVMLGDTEAIPLVIGRMPDGLDAKAVADLQKVTGCGFSGRDQAKWLQWWQDNRQTYSIPPDVARKFREEALALPRIGGAM